MRKRAGSRCQPAVALTGPPGFLTQIGSVFKASVHCGWELRSLIVYAPQKRWPVRLGYAVRPHCTGWLKSPAAAGASRANSQRSASDIAPRSITGRPLRKYSFKSSSAVMLARWSIMHAARAAAVGGASVPAAALGARRRGAGGAVARPLALVDGSSAVAAAAAAASERAAERARVDGRAGQRGPLGEARQVRRALGGRARREEHRERLGVARQRRLVDRRAPAGVALRRRRARAQQLVDEADGADERRHVERAVAARVDVRRLPRLAAQHLGQHRAHLRLEREDVLVPQQRAPHVGPPERARDVAGLDAVHPVEERVRHGVRVRRRRERCGR